MFLGRLRLLRRGQSSPEIPRFFDHRKNLATEVEELDSVDRPEEVGVGRHPNHEYPLRLEVQYQEVEAVGHLLTKSEQGPVY